MKNLILAFASFAVMSAPSSEMIEDVSHNEETSVSQTESSSEKITFEDEDGNGIPDVVERYYDTNIRDQFLFGLSLGAVITLAINIAGIIWKIRKESQNRKENEKINKEKDELIDKQNSMIEKLVSKFEGGVAKLDYIVESSEKSFDKLPTYEGLNMKLDAILKNQSMITAQDKGMISSGIADRVIKNIEEVTENDKERAVED